MQQRAKRYAFLLFPVIVGAIWIPFGFKTTGILEEWLYLPRGDMGWQILFQPSGGLHYLRPLVDMPHHFAVLLTPGSFIGYNVVMAALIAAKGIALYAILSELTDKTLFAFVAAVMFMIYPSDTALFSLRMVAVHTTVLAYLLAVWLLVKSLSVSRKRTFVLISAAIAVLHAINLLIYEVSYPLIFFTPLLLVWRDGRINRRVVVRAAVWYLIPLLTFIRFIVLLIFSPEMTFQRMLLEQAENAGAARGEIILRQLEQLFTRNTYLGWLRTAQSIPDTALEFLIIGVSLGVVAGILCWLLWKPMDRVSPRAALYWAAAGMGIVVLGFITYIPAGYLTTDRVYFFSSIGAGIFTAALLQLLVWWMPLRRLTTALLVGLLVSLGIIAGLEQHRDYVDRSLDQQRIIASIATQVPAMSDVAAILIFDESEKLYGGIFWDRQRIQNALRVLYEDSQLMVYFCTPYSSRANTFRANTLCEPRNDYVLLSPDYPNEEPTSVSYRHILTFVYQADGSLTLLEKFPSQYVLGQAPTDYQPEQLVCAECDPPRRVYTLLSEWPLPDMALPAPCGS